MKKIIIIIFTIPAAIIISLISLLLLGSICDTYIKKYRSYEKIYTSQNDRELAQLIENSIMQIANSRPNSINEIPTNPDLKDLEVNIKLDNIQYVCSAISVYSTSVPYLLEDIGIHNKYAKLIEDKKQTGFGESSSVILLIKENNDIIPIFASAYFFDVETEIKFPQKGYQTMCAEIPDKKLEIKIKPAPKEKALLVLE